KELSAISSNHRSTETLDAWLKRRGVVAMEGIDTRKLTKLTRTEGSLRCIVSTTDSDPKSLVEKAKSAASTDGRDLASHVTSKEVYTWSEGYNDFYPTEAAPHAGDRLRIVAYDFGIKRNILRSLVHAGFDVTVVPTGTTAEETLKHNPQAVFLSNGPGDPAAVEPGIQAVSKLIDQVPVFGICLGHQILSIVLGAKTHKMPFGHHGANHPVRDIMTGRVEITSQNHSFAVDPESLPDDIELSHINLNDQTVEGVQHKKKPIFSVQYHPEAAPGPLDAAHLFSRFHERVSQELGAKP
ncbi:MAG: glutamine-hydrolyzing carbamoyl-phosphate synthase small subunit, partial [Planctomycetota bacterium]